MKKRKSEPALETSAPQDALKTRSEALPEDRCLQFRVGLNLGDVIERGEDLFGDGINVATRLESIAEPGGICISSSIYDRISGNLMVQNRKRKKVALSDRRLTL